MTETKSAYSRNRRTKHYGAAVIKKLEAVEKYYKGKTAKWHNDAIELLYAKVSRKK